MGHTPRTPESPSRRETPVEPRRRPGLRAPSFAALACLALGATAGCTAYSTIKSVPLDCSAENAYDIDNIDAEFSMAWTSADGSPGAAISAAVAAIPDGPRCGDTTALVATSNNCNDRGSLFGFYAFGKKNESTKEGVSFWARAPGNTGKAFTMLMDDANSYDSLASCGPDGGVVPPPPDSGIFCTTYCNLDAGATNMGTVVDPSTNMVLSSGTSVAPPPSNSCGNDYQAVVTVTSDWRFYTIPFDRFQQQPNPNRVPNATFTESGTAYGTPLLTSAINNMTFRFPKESAEELWIDHLGFYGKKTGDGGSSGQ
jgi:hypothetical protein